MNDVTIIDQFLNTFATYIDSGFGLLRGEVAFLTATLIVIDMTIAGLYWAMSHATGQGEDVIAKLLRKVLYVGSFAYILNNFNWLASIVFRSFAGLGITATGSAITMENFLQPGRLAKTGIDAGAPILEQIGEMAGFPEVFVNLDPIVVMFLAWLVVVLCFFVLAIQLFITLIEFKLTTLAGFVLVPFALWNKTSFLAEKVLGNVVSAGVKVLVLAVIVGIGSGLFSQFQVHPAEPNIDHALVIMLASLTLLALGSSALASPRALCPVRPNSARARWPAPPSARPEPQWPSVLSRRALAARWPLVRAWPRPPPSWPAAVRAPPRRRPAARSRRSRPVPPQQAAAPRARWRDWATSPRPARSPPDALPHPALPLPGNAWPRRSVRAGTATLARQPARPPLAKPPQALPLHSPPSSPPGPSGCNAASNSPTPRPPPPTRCAVATAAAQGKARACAAPTTDAIHKENRPCDSRNRRCATPTRRSLPRRTKLPARYGTTVSARRACRRRTGA